MSYDQYGQPQDDRNGPPQYQIPPAAGDSQQGYWPPYDPTMPGAYGQPAYGQQPPYDQVYDPAYGGAQQYPYDPGYAAQTPPPNSAPPFPPMAPLLPPPTPAPARNAVATVAIIVLTAMLALAVIGGGAFILLSSDSGDDAINNAGKQTAGASPASAAPSAQPRNPDAAATTTAPPPHTPGLAINSRVAATSISVIAVYQIDGGYMSDFCDHIDDRLNVAIDGVYDMGIRAADFAEIRNACQTPSTYNSTVDEYHASLAYVALILYGDGRVDCSEICDADSKGRLAQQKRYVDAAARYSAGYVTPDSIDAAFDSLCKGIGPLA